VSAATGGGLVVAAKEILFAGDDTVDTTNARELRQYINRLAPKATDLLLFLRDHRKPKSVQYPPRELHVSASSRRYGYTRAQPALLVDSLDKCSKPEEAVTLINGFAREQYGFALTNTELSPARDWQDVNALFETIAAMSLLPSGLYDTLRSAMPPETQAIALAQRPAGPCDDKYERGSTEWFLHVLGHQFEAALLPHIATTLSTLTSRPGEYVSHAEFQRRPNPLDYRSDFADEHSRIFGEEFAALWDRLIGLDVATFEGVTNKDLTTPSVRVKKFALAAAAIAEVVDGDDPDRDLLTFLKPLYTGLEFDRKRSTASLYAKVFTSQYTGRRLIGRTNTQFSPDVNVSCDLMRAGPLSSLRDALSVTFGSLRLDQEPGTFSCSDERVKITSSSTNNFLLDVSALPDRARFTLGADWTDRENGETFSTGYNVRLGPGRQVDFTNRDTPTLLI